MIQSTLHNYILRFFSKFPAMRSPVFFKDVDFIQFDRSSYIDHIMIDTEYLCCYFITNHPAITSYHYFLLYYNDPEFMNKLDFFLTNLKSTMIYQLMLTLCETL